ncbi:TetR/AcrR family transcriptional regulator [Brevibacillus massiliensis]|jgi:AcrR family transcriptional regulator|uniref:TetR/AcrR family transcriptional regulator n=1 Tax=Brevibacillus massiliensis TaxID=1118054 RepID=UPI0002F31065|nr:TetR/AcrR family transcriptional regulator [Brevibacillus massiliensis]
MAKPNVISKQDLIESAKQCIVEHGIQQLTLKAVAEKAGVSQGTVYYHFRQKEQLLLDVVSDLCHSSWKKIQQPQPGDPDVIRSALESARSRCTADSSYHQLFFSLVVSGLQHEEIRKQLGELIETENRFLQDQLAALWPHPPVQGVSRKTWAILLNAMIDGLALQALVCESFSADEVYGELYQLIRRITAVSQAAPESREE